MYFRVAEQAGFVRHLVDLAAQYYALDVRPFLLTPAGLERIGPDPIPAYLRERLRDEGERLERLRYRLFDALQREKTR